MKIIFEIIGMLVLWFAIIYLLFAFYAVSFNPAEWTEGTRKSVLYIFFMGLFVIIIPILIVRYDK